MNKQSIAVNYIKDNCASLVVTLSGGVDSAVLLYLAVKALGPGRVAAVTGRSDSMTDRELHDAAEVARSLGCRHVVLETREMDRPEYRANAGDRCFHCRKELFEIAAGWAAENGFGSLAYGAIKDDLGDYRPGMKAAEELQVLAPMLQAGLTKEDVRRIADTASLPVKDKPANPCLASRIPAGVEITTELLFRIAAAEEALRNIGFRQLRVRHHGDVARLELDETGMEMMQDPVTRRRAVERIKGAGYRFVALDLEGYRTGTMNPPDSK